MNYKGNSITESQIEYLIKDRKYLLEELNKELVSNNKLINKIKAYEKIIGFLLSISLIFIGLLILNKSL